MNENKIKDLLKSFKEGLIDDNEIINTMKSEPFTDLGFAKIDNHRALRQGVAEVIYGEGKSIDQIQDIFNHMLKQNVNPIVVTRLQIEKAKSLERKYSDFHYSEVSKIGYLGQIPIANAHGKIAVLCAGTSDLYAAEEAALTAELLGNEVVRIYDVGVAGLHRLLSYMNELNDARVIIAVAGMEGALPSVVAGLVSVPVIAVPTSVGYGASFEGISALLAMLNSCASGISVVNIDNGFGAAYQASLINHL